MLLIHRLLIEGPLQAISLPKAALVAARHAGHITQSRDVYGYLTVHLSPAGYQHAVAPRQRTEAVVMHLLGERVRKVLPTGEPWPAVTPPPRNLLGHVKNWLAYADSNHACAQPKENGRRYCIEQGWIELRGAVWKLTQAGVLAAVALGACAVTPWYRVTDPEHATLWQDYKLCDVPLPQVHAAPAPVARELLAERVERLEAALLELKREIRR